MGTVACDREVRAYARARGFAPAALDAWRRALAVYLSPAPVRPILDVGSGTGHFALPLAAWFDATVIGIEPSAGMRAEARRTNTSPRVAYVGGRAEELPLRDASCAAGWLSTVVHQIADLEACARELARVLVADACVLVRGAFPGRLDRIALFRFFPAARRVAEAFPGVEDVAAAFAGAGFRLAEVTDVAQVSAASLQDYGDRLHAARRADTTLVGLDEREFDRGMRAVAEAAARDAGGAPVVDALTLMALRRGRAA